MGIAWLDFRSERKIPAKREILSHSVNWLDIVTKQFQGFCRNTIRASSFQKNTLSDKMIFLISVSSTVLLKKTMPISGRNFIIINNFIQRPSLI